MTTTVKTCFKCGAEKPLTEFYRHPQMGDGHLNKCKECTRSDVRKNRAKRVKYYREYDRRRGARRSYEDIRRYRKDNPEKYSAHTALNNALRRGDVVKKPCEICGREDTHGHHEDYSKPLDVNWLCPPCHFERHKKTD